MQRTLSALVGVLFAIALLIVIAPMASPQSPGTINVGLYAGEPASVDPGVILSTTVSRTIFKGVYESLVDLPGTERVPKPLLATSWTISKDGRVYDFSLRRNVRFVDGTIFDGSAVKANFDRIFALNREPASSLRAIDRVEVITPERLRIVLKAPFADFLSILVWINFVSPKAIAEHEKNGDHAQAWLRDHAVGTGPYTLDRWIPGQQLVLTRNDNYWGGWSGNHLRRIILRPIGETGTQRLMLEKGDLDIAQAVTVEDAATLARNPQIAVRRDEGFSQFQIFMNTQKGPTKDRRVREAIAYAYDYDGHIRGAMRGTVNPAQGPFAPEMAGGLPGMKPVVRDLGRARELLRQAGYEKGGFALRYKYISGRNEDKKAGEILQASLAEIGVKVDISEGPWPTLLGQLQDLATAHELFPYVTVPFYNSPDALLFAHYHSSQMGKQGRNLTYYNNSTVDQLIDNARSESTLDKRLDMYREAARLISNDHVAIYISRNINLQAFRNRVKGFQYNPIKPYIFYFYEMYVD